jgi:hypothetical protein
MLEKFKSIKSLTMFENFRVWCFAFFLGKKLWKKLLKDKGFLAIVDIINERGRYKKKI